LRLAGPLIGRTQKFEPPLLQDSLSGAHQNEGQANKTEEVRTKRRKVLFEVQEQKITSPYPIFKPVSLPDFQIGDDTYDGLQRLMRRRPCLGAKKMRVFEKFVVLACT
jgi:hypothetical protein